MAGMAEDDLASQRRLRHAVALMNGRRQLQEKENPPMRHTSGLYETTIELNEASGISHRICSRENSVQSWHRSLVFFRHLIT